MGSSDLENSLTRVLKVKTHSGQLLSIFVIFGMLSSNLKGELSKIYLKLIITHYQRDEVAWHQIKTIKKVLL